MTSLARTLTLRLGRLDEAIHFGSLLAELAPDDRKNRLSLAHAYLARGDFQDAAEQADALIGADPLESGGYLLKAQALVAQHGVDDALRALSEGLSATGSDAKLLGLARNITFLHGRFEESEAYSLSLIAKRPGDLNEAKLVQTYAALGKIAEADSHLAALKTAADYPLSRKMRFYLSEYRKLRTSAPAIPAVWEAALANRHTGQLGSGGKQGLAATMIQYWSQGQLPADVVVVHNAWTALFERERLGRIQLFNRATAERWIAENAPQFSRAFANAFHYAVEADIFRIAYASKLPCIYMDVDCWPLEGTVEVIRCALAERKTTLYFRAYRPWIANGCFVSYPDNAFIQELVSQCLEVDLSVLPKNHLTIENSFGPSRYNKVLADILRGKEEIDVSPGTARGTSNLTFQDGQIGFAHEGVFASVKPPFSLGYKATEANWKGVSIDD